MSLLDSRLTLSTIGSLNDVGSGLSQQGSDRARDSRGYRFFFSAQLYADLYMILGIILIGIAAQLNILILSKIAYFSLCTKRL
ncbi:hypothetical protein QOZ95_001351 [Paenibacillus brasilensis]|uniref:Uncharacterized protein n=1 Tax=Paenibacillus brasilensis TaxID=128574 RepID=A0ABU0KX91_9BACL|nr:hypothetical protein [Paenibacillus brasilensis]